ncbi:MAG: hypothetical protein EAZ60_03100 [Oscillatoriales cyanobacterium]|nr:MAG: hypothetical protein EAZ60_03100 [Oscillatoriales cyanobacterium]
MSYRTFTFQQLKDRFGLEMSLSPILSAKIIPLEPERIISPILLEFREKNHRQFSIFSGWAFDVDVSQGLHGECDFLFSGAPLNFEIKVPFFALRETKSGEIESCLPQCAAQMVIPAVFGCVTSGVVWRFLKLKGNNLIIDDDVYYLDNLPTILGVLQKIVNLYK